MNGRGLEEQYIKNRKSGGKKRRGERGSKVKQDKQMDEEQAVS